MIEQKIINPCAQLDQEKSSFITVPEADVLLEPRGVITKFPDATTGSIGAMHIAGVNLLIANVVDGDTPFKEVVVKTPRSSRDLERIKKESELTATLARMGIQSIPFLPFEDETLGGARVALNGVTMPAVISRYASQGDLGKPKNQPRSSGEVGDFLCEMADALEPIAKLACDGSIVCDIKPSNFVRYNESAIGSEYGAISFVDYGSVVNTGSGSSSFTVKYTPPEMLMPEGKITEQTALFGIGASIINIVAGASIVYSGVDRKGNGAVAIESTYNSIMGKFTNRIADVLKASIELDPINRPSSLKEVQKVLAEAC